MNAVINKPDERSYGSPNGDPDNEGQLMLVRPFQTGRDYLRIERFNDHPLTTHELVVRVLHQARENMLDDLAGRPAAREQRTLCHRVERQDSSDEPANKFVPRPALEERHCHCQKVQHGTQSAPRTIRAAADRVVDQNRSAITL